MAERNKVILTEAEAWRREGRITAEFHDWIRAHYPAKAGAETARSLQAVLLTVAGLLVLIGIITLVSQLWDNFTRTAKLFVLLGFAAIAVLLARLAEHWKQTAPLSHVLLPLSVPLLLFALVYVGDENRFATTNTLSGVEAGWLIVSAILLLGALAWGLRAYPTLAMAAPPALLFLLVGHLQGFANFDQEGGRAILWIGLGVVLVVHAFLLLLWRGMVRLPYEWQPLAARITLAANVPWGFGLLVALTEEYNCDMARCYYDDTYVGVAATALYVGVLLAFALRLGLAELTGIGGLFLVADGIWLGAGKGGVVGAVLAIFAAAIVLGLLAQRGVLLRILKPQPPTTRPTRGAGPTKRA